MASHGDTLVGLARRYGWKRGAEIGVLRGAVFFKLLQACPNLSMIGVDTWDYWPGPVVPNLETGEARHSHLPMKQFEEEVMKQAPRYGARARIIKKLSVEAAKDVPDNSLDFCFIDATHTEPAVLEDIAAWAPKVRAGGFMTGHDINYASVKRAVDRRFKMWAEMNGYVWVARRDALVPDTAGAAA